MRSKNADKVARKVERKRKGTGKFVGLCILVFVAAAALGVASRMLISPSWAREYSVAWSDELGTRLTDLPYGDGEAQKFDLYLPADSSRRNYGLVVYLHPGGFTSGDKSGDEQTLAWLCSKGYVAAGINYTLFSEEHPEANVRTQSDEIKAAMPCVVQAAEQAGFHVNKMAVAGGSAGGCLALIYAYRDAGTSPVPVTMVFEAVGPSSFYPEDWSNYGFDQPGAEEAAAGLFSTMCGTKITPDMFGTAAYDEAVKPVSALLWVSDQTVPTVMAYGKYDTMQPFAASVRLDAALTEHGVRHEYLVAEHSGHGLQNDDEVMRQYMQKVEEYLVEYLPVE
jgi:acetyl esterase/lipase